MAAVAVLALLGFTSRASALILTGGPVYTLPGGGSCSVSGVASQTGGATVSCTGVNLGPHTKVYFGIRNDINVNGNTMTGADPATASAAVFRINTTGASSITYTSTTTVTSSIPSLGSDTVNNKLILTLTAGSASVVATGGNPANSASNGDIANLFQLTSGTSFTFRADVRASDPDFAEGQACPAVYDPDHATTGAGGDHSKVDVAFYFSNCGDSQIDSPEQCDDGPANGTLPSCCSATCTFKSSGTACTDDGNVCTNDQCNGAAVCTHPNNSAPCNDGLFCNGADTCSGGTCSIHPGNPCPGPDGDGNCSESCNEAADNCTAPDPNGSACTDGLFCNGTDTCSGGTCTAHTGDPCPGADGDANCAESCDEALDNCTAPDPNGSPCTGNGSGECSGADTCSAGTCSNNDVPAGTSCTDSSPPSAGNCKDAQCNGSGTCDQNFANESDGTTCSDGLFCDGTETCTSGACGGSTGDPCPGPDGDGNCSETCNEAADDCSASDPDGSACTDGLFCTGTDSCTGGACTTHSGDPCPGPNGDTNCSESCDESADNCTGADPDGSSCRAAAGPCDIAETCSSGACPSDQLEPSGFVCDPGSGDLCDPDELCDGSTVSCPADTVSPSGTVCNPGSGDSCDPDEVCSGTAGQPCPSDTVTPSGTLCRAGSGDLCDPDETCTGVADQPCPFDVVQSNSTVCRPGSGDVCDPAEVCPGVPTGPCAPDVVAPATTVCNPGSGDLCDPDETCSGTAGQPCPADNVASSSTVCRGAAGVCDVAETCSGTADTPCPADAKQPNTTPCRGAVNACDVAETCDGVSNNCPADLLKPDNTPCSDGQFCNGAETCMTGVCTAGTAPCSMTCDEVNDVCLATGCSLAPEGMCRTSLKSLLLIKNKTPDSKDKLIWKWIKGASTTQPEFGDPTTTADYSLCIYTGSSPSLAATIDVPSGANWSTIGTRGYKYLDLAGTANGVKKIIVKGSTSNKSKALLKGGGANLPDPLDSVMMLDLPVQVQLVNHGSGVCFESIFNTPKKNTSTLFKAKQ